MSPRQFAASTDLPSTRSRSPWLFNLALTLPFVLLYWADLIHHEAWFDEINAWGIACAAPTLSRLFYYVHYEGHPWLWYFILWIPARFTHDPAALKWVEGVFGTAIYLMLGLLSPFTRVQKLLILASYYVIFEYTVMSRMYSVMFLLALCYVFRRARRPEAVIGNVALLGAIANTDMTGVLLSGALLLEYGYSCLTAPAGVSWRRNLKQREWLALLIYLAMLAFSIHSLIPARDISWQASGHVGTEMYRPRRMVQSIGNLVAAPWWPISNRFPRSFWNTDALNPKGLLLLVPIVLYAYGRTFERERNLQLLMGLTLLFGILFADIVYWGSVRHWGIAFVSFLLALWMQRVKRERAGEVGASRWSPWATALMSLSALAGMAAITSAWMHPFVRLPDVAQWIGTHEPRNVPLVGDHDLTLASIAEELQRPVYFMECGCTDTFKLFTKSRDKFQPEELPTRLDLAMKNLGAGRVVLVNTHLLTPEMLAQMQQESMAARILVSFQGSTDDEKYFLYSVTRQ